MFVSAPLNSALETKKRKATLNKLLKFGIPFLDDALHGIFPSDSILLGAPSGMGKTQLCCNIANANLDEGKTVHYIALEAEEFEIESRLKYQFFAERFFGDPNRPRMRMSFDIWMQGRHIEECETYESWANDMFEKSYPNLFLYQKRDKFTVNDLIQQVLLNSEKTDLIIVDHVHYFDFDDDNENRAVKEIAKTTRSLTLEEGRPMILVAHLRKRDKGNEDLVAGMEEFHGSSDLYKIATKVITMAPGNPTQDGNFETFFRIPKNRLNGGVSRYTGRCLFSPKKGRYEKAYKIGWANLTRRNGFEELDHSLYPEWANKGSSMGSDGHDDASRKPQYANYENRQRALQYPQEKSEGF